MTPPEQITPSPFQVVVYTDAMGIGGAEISLGHLIAAVSTDIILTVVGVSAAVVDAIAAHRPSAVKIVLPSTGLPAIAAHLTTLHRLQPAIVHFNLCTPWACAIGLATALLLPKARVVRVDQLPLRTTDAMTLWRTRLLSLRVDAHVAVGEASARRMEDFYALGRGTVQAIPNGVPDFEVNSLVSCKHPHKPSSHKPPSHKPLLIGSVGRLDAMKAHDVLLRAIAQVDDVQVEILGEGEQRTALETLADELGIRDRVHLPGWSDQPRAHLLNYDIFVLPSRSEGFPLAIVEAMLAARPIIATQVGSIAEAVVHNETGLLIEKDDVMGLVSALQCLKDDASLRDRMGRRGRVIAIEQFTAAQMAKRYEQLWHKVMSMPRSPRLCVPRPRD